MEDTTREELGQNQNANLAGADVDDDGCEGVKMREGVGGSGGGSYGSVSRLLHPDMGTPRVQL